MSAAMWEWLDPLHTSLSDGASLSPKRPRHDRRDSGVSAAVWEWLDPSHPIWLSHLREEWGRSPCLGCASQGSTG